jgi:hypothetical protein
MVFWRMYSNRRYYEASIDLGLMFGVSTDRAGTWTVAFGPLEFWTHPA